MISSTRSCNQNTGLTRSTKRLKLTDVMGIESGSRALNNGAGSPFFLLTLAGGVVGIPGSAVESSMLGIRFSAADDALDPGEVGDMGDMRDASGGPWGRCVLSFNMRAFSTVGCFSSLIAGGFGASEDDRDDVGGRRDAHAGIWT